MRLRTIWWGMPGMALTERLGRTREVFWRSLAHHLPRPLAYWSYIDSGARAMATGNDVVPEVTYMDLLAKLEGSPR